MRSRLTTVIVLLALLSTATLRAQERGRIEGTVILGETGAALNAATVIILELDLQTETDRAGQFRFSDLPPGLYHLVAHVSSALTEESQVVTVRAGGTVSVEFRLGLAELHQKVNVTATGRAIEPSEAIQSGAAADLLAKLVEKTNAG